MFPLADTAKDKGPAAVTKLLIAANVAVFGWEVWLAMSAGDGGLERFVGEHALVAKRIVDDLETRAVALVKSLPDRRRQVLELMARGLLNKQIAWELKISEKTVKMHRALLLEQLGVATSADAIRIAVEAGL